MSGKGQGFEARAAFRRLLKEQRGGVAAIIGLAIIPLFAAIGLWAFQTTSKRPGYSPVTAILDRASDAVDGVRRRSLEAEDLPVLPPHRHARRPFQLTVEVGEPVGVVLRPGRGHEVEHQVQPAARPGAELGLPLGVEPRQPDRPDRVAHGPPPSSP